MTDKGTFWNRLAAAVFAAVLVSSGAATLNAQPPGTSLDGPGTPVPRDEPAPFPEEAPRFVEDAPPFVDEAFGGGPAHCEPGYDDAVVEYDRGRDKVEYGDEQIGADYYAPRTIKGPPAGFAPPFAHSQWGKHPFPGQPCEGGYGHPHYPWPQRYYGSYYRPRAFGLRQQERCDPDLWRPRGYGHLFNEPSTCHRMEYIPYIVKAPYSEYGPTYWRRQRDPRCKICLGWDYCDCDDGNEDRTRICAPAVPASYDVEAFSSEDLADHPLN